MITRELIEVCQAQANLIVSEINCDWSAISSASNIGIIFNQEYSEEEYMKAMECVIANLLLAKLIGEMSLSGIAYEELEEMQLCKYLEMAQSDVLEDESLVSLIENTELYLMHSNLDGNQYIRDMIDNSNRNA